MRNRGGRVSELYSPAGVILRREAPKDLAAAESAGALDRAGGEILRGSAAQDDTCNCG
jgi:hypothetical protein